MDRRVAPGALLAAVGLLLVAAAVLSYPQPLQRGYHYEVADTTAVLSGHTDAVRVSQFGELSEFARERFQRVVDAAEPVTVYGQDATPAAFRYAPAYQDPHSFHADPVRYAVRYEETWYLIEVTGPPPLLDRTEEFSAMVFGGAALVAAGAVEARRRLTRPAGATAGAAVAVWLRFGLDWSAVAAAAPRDLGAYVTGLLGTLGFLAFVVAGDAFGAWCRRTA